MLKTYLPTLLLVSFFCTCVSAQQRVSQVFGPDYYENFNDADIAPGGNGWAVGAYELHLKTSDGGDSWTDVSDRFDGESEHISCLPGTNCETVFRTSGQGLLASFNGGQSWETVIEEGLFGEFDYSLPGTIFSWQDRQKDVAISTDGGQNWSVINTDIARIQTKLLVTSATEFGFFESSRFYQTTDGGQSFSQGEAILDRPASLATVANNGDYYAVDRSTKLWRSTNKGVNWTLHNDNIYQYTVHNGLWMDDSDVLHYTSFLGIHVTSADGGLTWERVSGGPRLWSARRYKKTETGHLAIGSGNSLHQYDAAENTYRYLLGDVHPSFITMDFSPDGTTGYASTRDGLLYKSTNGGQDWAYTNTTIPGDPIKLIARSANEVLYLGKNSRLLKSTDGGLLSQTSRWATA